MRVVNWWFDEKVITLPPQTFVNSQIPAGRSWTDSRYETGGAMWANNYYYWNWHSWNTTTAIPNSATYSSGRSGNYNCYY